MRRKLSTWWGYKELHHHDLSDAVTNRYNENVQKLKDVLKVSDPFATEECHLVNIITKAVMPDYIKEGVLTRDKIGQALSDTFAQERIVEAKLSVWSPMKKANLKSWKSASQKNKNKTTCGVAPLKDDRALFARFLVVSLSRPDLDIKETISTFELAEYPRALFFSDGSLRHCATKSKLMNILESLLPAQQQPQTSTVQPHSADPSSRQVVIIDAMAVAQAMGKPPWVRNGRDLASHFIEVIDSSLKVLPRCVLYLTATISQTP